MRRCGELSGRGTCGELSGRGTCGEWSGRGTYGEWSGRGTCGELSGRGTCVRAVAGSGQTGRTSGKCSFVISFTVCTVHQMLCR